MPGLAGPGIARVCRWCQQRGPGHARDRVRVECDVGPRHLAIVECRPPWRQGAGRRMDAVLGHPAPLHLATRTWPLSGGTVTCASTSDELEPSPGSGGLMREIDRDPIGIFWG